MLIKKKSYPTIPSSEITPISVFNARRQFIKSTGAAFLATLPLTETKAGIQTKKYTGIAKSAYGLNLPVNHFDDVANYTNYYEFSTNKTDSSVLAQRLSTKPWSLTVEGQAEKTGVFDLEDILKANPQEQRIYRFRCVEGWSMVVPWIGFPLGTMLKQFQPNAKAKFVEFTTLYNPSLMVGQKSAVLAWPYVEGLRIDEAMHPLTILATGMYDDELPKQNGAPLRLIVPWKYGFKSIKAIVKIRFTETMPISAWRKQAPHEYGFYANVNPNVPHPRWSQSRERVLGANIFTPKRATELFNGYAEDVAGLYAGMDLTKNY